MIRIQGLHKFFNRGRQNEIHVINGVSLDLPERGMVAIFGESGCGKTTLLNVIGGLDSFAEGTLTIEGQSIEEDTDIIRNRYIGYIFQNYNLQKAESCYDNVADALRLCGMTDEEEIERRVHQALLNVGMEKYAKRIPDTLSGGQQQRIAIARAIVKNPRIILADEPTGNLDEANTVMIMDLLRAIAKDHLVLLVTHEENLVDYYCDTVIQLRDGQVVSTRENAMTNGYATRGKNDIYLGELERRELSCANAELTYYGDAPAEPIKLKIVNSGGKIYVQIDTERVQILDAASEVRLREGVYEEQAREEDAFDGIDMSGLPPVEGDRYGRLFTLQSSIKSGFAANFKGKQKRKYTLIACMCLFAFVIVFMSAAFGVSIGDLLDARGAYNHNVFYVCTPDSVTSAILNAALAKPDAAIDYVRLTGEYPYGDTTVSFHGGNFETFTAYDWASGFETNAVYLDVSLAKDLPLVEGKSAPLDNTEILITTKVADALLEKSTLGYVTEREDLIGLICETLSIDGRRLRIAGILKSDEPAIYLTELAMAKHVHQEISLSHIALASDYGIALSEGEAILFLRNREEAVSYPKAGDRIQIQGRDIRVKEIREFYRQYADFAVANGKKVDMNTYFSELVKVEQPTLEEGSTEFSEALSLYRDAHYYEYYDYLLSDADLRAYYEDYAIFTSELYVWLYLEHGVEEAKYFSLPTDYYQALAYKNKYGVYPAKTQLDSCPEQFPLLAEVLSDTAAFYEDEYHFDTVMGVGNIAYLVNDSDYIAFSKQMGETHPSASATMGEVGYDGEYLYGVNYTVVHSTDPEATAAWLLMAFANSTIGDVSYEAVITPDTIFDRIVEEERENIIVRLITMAVMVVLMSVCMYFMMRSALMNRIKEIGIYRAIGVSKRNLLFKFFIESLVLTTLTVFVGYLIASILIWISLGMSTIVEQGLFYPWWMAGVDLILLYAISLLFGIVPIIPLLCRTPSAILAKYDI